MSALKSRLLLRSLCGWDSASEVPSKPTFRRAFRAFTQDQLPQKNLDHMVKTYAGIKLEGERVSRDTTAIKAPERPTPKSVPATHRKRGRPKPGAVRPPAPPKRLDLQPACPPAENPAALPARCDAGCKRNSQGHRENWIGYKLHLDTVDGDFPVSAVLTNASGHDS